ncbi:MAG TPA: hypothetical protein VIR03_01635 [Candidatus Saccharimonadales bacterium]
MPDEERRLVTTDDELDGKRKLVNFHVERIAKYAVLVLSIVAASAIVMLVLYVIFTDRVWRDYAIKSVLQGLPGIMAVVLVVLGLKKSQ